MSELLLFLLPSPAAGFIPREVSAKFRFLCYMFFFFSLSLYLHPNPRDINSPYVYTVQYDTVEYVINIPKVSTTCFICCIVDSIDHERFLLLIVLVHLFFPFVFFSLDCSLTTLAFRFPLSFLSPSPSSPISLALVLTCFYTDLHFSFLVLQSLYLIHPKTRPKTQKRVLIPPFPLSPFP